MESKKVNDEAVEYQKLREIEVRALELHRTTERYPPNALEGFRRIARRELERERELVEAVGLLRELEWIEDFGTGKRFCEICKAPKSSGHDNGCRLAKFLEGKEKPRS